MFVGLLHSSVHVRRFAFRSDGAIFEGDFGEEYLPVGRYTKRLILYKGLKAGR